MKATQTRFDIGFQEERNRLMSHVIFGVCMFFPAIWLLVMKKPMAVKKDFVMLAR